MKHKISFYSILFCISSFFATAFVSSCSDKVDDSNLYTFTGETMIDYIASREDLSSFNFILNKVKLNSNTSESTLAQLLSTRGHYTCFAPTNSAVKMYLDSLYDQENYDINLIPDSTAANIAKGCIIDNGSEDAYLTTSFVEGVLEKTNMNDRFITVSFDTLVAGAIKINTLSTIINKDIEVENGVLHTLDKVLAPSTSNLPALMELNKDITIFTRLLEETGWASKMIDYRDFDYEDWALTAVFPTSGAPGARGTDIIPEHHNSGYTAFVESDETLAKAFGVTPIINPNNGNIENWSEVYEAVKAKCAEYYPSANPSADITSEDNPVNQFISYHLVDAAIAYNKLVIHYCEIGAIYTKPDEVSTTGLNAWEYYETMGKQRRSLKITEGSNTNGKRINRHSTYELENYTESSVDRPGIKIEVGSSDNNALNGYYYMIDDVLVYDDDVPNVVLNERMRYDVTALLPELMTNGYRRPSTHCGVYLKTGYLKNLTLSAETKAYYLSGYGQNTWKNYQGDELNIVGQYDITLRLPPVPYTGTYELRTGLSINPLRGMAQIYIGEDPDRLNAVGLPLDLRVQMSSALHGWVTDTDDEETNNENDKNLKNHGYLKSPLYYGYCNATGTKTSFRNTNGSATGATDAAVRKVLYTGSMEAGKTYYVRFKSVLKNASAQFYFDYIELVPRSVYNGSEAEDKW